MIETTANNLSGRALATRRGILHSRAYTTQADQLSDIRAVTKDQLFAEGREMAMKIAKEWFNRFQWDPDERQLREIQLGFLGRQG